jgi:hypothetical protein
MSQMTEQMSKASRTAENAPATPQVGDHFRCRKCGMALEITTGCGCKDADHVHFLCCGQEMEKDS